MSHRGSSALLLNLFKSSHVLFREKWPFCLNLVYIINHIKFANKDDQSIKQNDLLLSPLCKHICLFVLRFNIPVNNFSVMLGRSNFFLGFNLYSGELMCLA